MKKPLFCILASMALLHPSWAELSLAKLYGDHSVLQRNVPLPVIGRAEPGAAVTVDFAGQTKKSVTDELGRWKVVLDPMPASKEGRQLRVTGEDGTEIVSNDLLVGDVWLAAGQSNMAFPVNASLPDPTDPKQEDSYVRFFQPKPEFSALPHEDYFEDVDWLIANPKNLVWLSAPAWFFAVEVRKQQDIPIGMVVAARGGTAIQAFLPASAHGDLEGAGEFSNLAKIKEELVGGDVAAPVGRAAFDKGMARVDGWLARSDSDLANGKQPPPVPALTAKSPQMGGIYNLLLHPLRNFPIKGLLWYQGETNGGDQKMYFHLLNAFLKSLRSTLGSGEFPAYIVQLAPFVFKGNTPESEGSAGVREAQREVAMTLPNTGLVVTLDIGDANDIHPKNKVDVGRRLAYLALHRDYGMKDVMPSGPLLKSHEIQGDQVILTFDYVGGGLMAGTKAGTDEVKESSARFEAFQLAGENKEFVPAKAEIRGDKLVLTAVGLTEPKYARYAYSSAPQGPLLYNKEGLPASTFKTDPW